MHSNAAARRLFTLEFANWSSCPAQAPTFGLRYRGKVQLEEGVSGRGGHHDECGARAYNGGLGAEPPAGSNSRAPGQGVRGQSPPEAESILVIGCPTESANLAPLVKVST